MLKVPALPEKQVPCSFRLFLLGMRVWLMRGCRPIPEERDDTTYPAAVKHTLTVGILSAGALLLLVKALPSPQTTGGRVIWTGLLTAMLAYGLLAILRDVRDFAKRRCADGRRWLAQQADGSQTEKDANEHG